MRPVRKDSKLSGNRFEEAVQMYRNGKSTQEIAVAFGVDASNVFRVLKGHGIKLRTKKEAGLNAVTTGRSKRKCGEHNHSWKGGRHRSSHGYILVYAPYHPRAASSSYVYEHDLVVERAIGRFLAAGEIVHHKNGQKDDNRLDNLELTTPHKHGKHHARLCNNRIGIHFRTTARPRE